MFLYSESTGEIKINSFDELKENIKKCDNEWYYLNHIKCQDNTPTEKCLFYICDNTRDYCIKFAEKYIDYQYLDDQLLPYNICYIVDKINIYGFIEFNKISGKNINLINNHMDYHIGWKYYKSFADKRESIFSEYYKKNNFTRYETIKPIELSAIFYNLILEENYEKMFNMIYDIINYEDHNDPYELNRRSFISTLLNCKEMKFYIRKIKNTEYIKILDKIEEILKKYNTFLLSIEMMGYIREYNYDLFKVINNHIDIYPRIVNVEYKDKKIFLCDESQIMTYIGPINNDFYEKNLTKLKPEIKKKIIRDMIDDYDEEKINSIFEENIINYKCI